MANNYGTLGLFQGFNKRQGELRDEGFQDQQRTRELNREDFADSRAKTTADQQDQQFAANQDEGKARLGLVGIQTDQAKQSLDQGAKSFSTDQRIKNYQLLQSKLNLDDEQMNNLHNAVLGSSKMLHDQLAQLKTDPKAAIDGPSIEKAYNEAAPDGQKMVPGSFRIQVDPNNAGNSVISYTNATTGKQNQISYDHWTQYATAFAPPEKAVTVKDDERLVKPSTGQVILDSDPNAANDKVTPTTCTSQVSRQIGQANGGTFDENGNLKVLDPKLSKLVNSLSGIAADVGRVNNYQIPAPTVAAAVQKAYDEAVMKGQDENTPGFQDRVQALLKPQAAGVNVPAPAQPALGAGGQAQPGSADIVSKAQNALKNGKDPAAVKALMQQMGASAADIQAAGL